MFVCLSKADAALLELLGAELTGVRLYDVYTSGGPVAADDVGEEDQLGTIVFGIEGGALELSLWPRAAVTLDAWLSRPERPARTYPQIAYDPGLQAVEAERPSPLVFEFARRLVTRWLVVAAGDESLAPGPATWRPYPEPRGVAGHLRALELDVILTQLGFQPIGAFALFQPTGAVAAP